MRQAENLVRLASGGALHVHGEPSDPPLLFLHGVGGGAWSWRPQIAAFSPGHRCYVWEGRGHGAAARVKDAGLGDYFTDAREALAAILDAERRPAVLIGHSMGGLLAMALAGEVGAGVAGLFLLDPVYSDGNNMGHMSGILGPFARVLIGPVVRSYQRDGALSRRISRSMFAGAFEDRAQMERAWIDQRTQIPVEYPKMLLEAFDGPSNFPRRDFAQEIAVPTMVVEGSSARRGPRFKRLVDTLRARLGPAFTYEVISSGHYLQLDRPAEVSARIAQFLERMAPHA